MPTDFAFRLSTYLALGLSCVCIGYSEWDILPVGTGITAASVALIGALFWAGGRYELDLRAANRLGVLIGAAAAVWVGYQFANRDSLLYTLPYPASLLPYVGALLTVLIPAKLVRPKHVGDWWALQGVGLAGVGLACSMADDEPFAVLLAAYAGVGLWSLILFFHRRAAGQVAPLPAAAPAPAPVVLAPAGRGPRAWVTVGGWLLAAVGIGLPLFFLTPRSGAPRWQFGQARLETGYAGEQMIDLTRTGELKVNREVAFEVRATTRDGRPKDDLSPGQRWRGVGFQWYENGKWGHVDRKKLPLDLFLIVPPPFRSKGQGGRPDFGPAGFDLEFTPRTKLVDPVLADPAVWDLAQPVPVGLARPPGDGWFQRADGQLRPAVVVRRVDRYVQHTRPVPAPGRPPDEADLSPPLVPRLALPGPNPPLTEEWWLTSDVSPVDEYRQLPTKLTRLRSWTWALLDRLGAADPNIRAAVGRAVTGVGRRDEQAVRPDDYEPVARALAGHLAGSGEYTYSLRLRRVDRTDDPIHDFLTRSKEGHCQRFAAGLALMLRAVGVPTAYVLGFKGCEPAGPGEYVVRQEHAHAWVEVLIPRRPPPGYAPPAGHPDPAPARVWHWLSLDPNPDADAPPPDTAIEGWLGSARATGAAFFSDYIVGYSPDRRDQAVAATSDWVVGGGGWAALVGVPAAVAGGLAGRAVWRRRRAARTVAAARRPTPAWFDGMVRALTAHGIPVPPGATPREYAAAAATALGARPGTAAVAGVPGEVAAALYQARYAGRPPGPADQARLEAGVGRLAAALRAAPREGPS